MPVPLVLPSCGRGSCWQPHKSRLRRGTMTARATTSLSLRYHVKPGQNKEAFAEMKGMLDRCAKEPEFIMAIIHETPERQKPPCSDRASHGSGGSVMSLPLLS